MHQLPTLVYAAVLGPDLARLIFGALLWKSLVGLNRGAAGASATYTSALAAQQAGDGSVQGCRERAAVRRD